MQKIEQPQMIEPYRLKSVAALLTSMNFLINFLFFMGTLFIVQICKVSAAQNRTQKKPLHCKGFLIN